MHASFMRTSNDPGSRVAAVHLPRRALRLAWCSFAALAALHACSVVRLLRRDAPFHQSNGHIYMHRTGASTYLALHDVFHVMLAMPSLLLAKR